MDVAIRIMAAWVIAATFIVVAMQPIPKALFMHSYYIIIVIVATVVVFGVC